MPKTSIPANAKGLSKFSRRTVLVGGAAASVSAATLAVSEVATAAVQQMSAKDRCAYHIHELALCMQEVHGVEYGWIIDHSNQCAFISRHAAEYLGRRVLP